MSPTPSHRRLARPKLSRILGAAVAFTALVGLPIVVSTTLTSPQAAATTYGIWSDSLVPAVPTDHDNDEVTLGVEFTSSDAGSITGIQFYGGADNEGPHTGQLWSARGRKLAEVSFPRTSDVGWQTATLSEPVKIRPGAQYTASYVAPHGNYAIAQNTFDHDDTVKARALTALRGTYVYGTGRPRYTWRDSNYYVDVVFDPADSTGPSTPQPTTPDPTTPDPTTDPTTPDPTTDPTTPDPSTPNPTTPAPSTPAPTTPAPTTPAPTTPAPTTPAPTTPAPTTPAPTTPTTSPAQAGSRGWQLDASNVGLAPYGLSCSSLPAYTGPAKPARGAVISNVRVGVPLDLSNGDITVEKACIRPTSTGYHNSFLVTTTICGTSCSATPVGNVVIRDSEIDASAMSADAIATSCAFLGVGTLQRNYMHGMGSGICFFETGLVHSALAEKNYVTGLRSSGDSHNEAATIRDFRKNANDSRTVQFIDNRLDASGGNTTGGLFIQPTWESIYNVTLRGNYFEGQGYNLYTETKGGTYGNLHAVDNRFRSTGWGPSFTSGPDWVEWSENYLYDAAKTDGKGAVVRP